MKKTNLGLALALLVGVGTMFSSCQNEEEITMQEGEISQEVIEKFKAVGFDPTNLRMQGADPVSGIPAGVNYLVEDDIVISPDQLEQMLVSEIHSHGAVGEQYRTTNLVAKPKVISVIGYTGGTNALTTKMRNALYDALIRYNNLNLGIRFTLTYSSNTNADIVVYRTQGGAGGSAGFPSGGNPYKWVQIYSGMESYTRNVNAHVIAHEIGHCLGLRHTDYFNRSLSCGTGGNEGAAGVGAIHIPGTPTGFDASSIMLSCFSTNVSGNFGNFDVVALRALY